MMNERLEAALRAALVDEYKARATYRAVIDALGPVQPFVGIVESEQRHVDALTSLFEDRGVEPPSDPYNAGVVAPRSFAAACRLGMQAEEENAALYDRLMEAAEDDPEVLWAFQTLRHASGDCHLEAFRHYLEGGKAAA